MSRLTEEVRRQKLDMLQKMTVSDVARHFKTSQKTIHLLMDRHAYTCSLKDSPRPGNLRINTPADERLIRTLHLRDKFHTPPGEVNLVSSRCPTGGDFSDFFSCCVAAF